MILQIKSATHIALGKLAISVGNFDGVHRGHQKIIRKLRKDAEQRGLTPAVLTFFRHPLAIIDPTRNPAQLTTVSEKLVLLARQGVAVTHLWDFTPELAAIPAASFMTVLRDKLNVRHLVIGHDHTFGRNREGNWQLLRQIAPSLGITVDYVDALLDDSHAISSSHLRRSILHGDVAAANKMLGYRFFLKSFVVRGRGDGHALGFPTVNLAPVDKIAPPPGVYAGRAFWGNENRPAAINISFANGERGTAGVQSGETNDSMVEAHLLNFDGDLYGTQIRLEFITWVREEIRFVSHKDLIAQIKDDVEEVRKLEEQERGLDLYG